MGRKDAKKRMEAKAAAAAEAEEAAGDQKKNDDPRKRKSDEELGFQQRSGPDAPQRLTANKDIEITDICISAGKLELLYNAVLKLTYGTKYGLVGRNGVGKSTLLRNIADRTVEVPRFMYVMHVEQEIVGDERTVLRSVLEADKEREWLLALEERLMAVTDDGSGVEPMVDGVTLMEVYERLDELNSDEAESRAAVILAGLGFQEDLLHRPTKEFSGGWRMRIALAQALFLQPDLLLLDEPTNHLDVPALTWLEEFLQSWEKTVIIVSHDRGFLNEVTVNTMFMKNKRLYYYGGNYDTFLRVRAEQRVNASAIRSQQTRRVASLKDFIARFGHGHKKMAKQAQSRMKLLKKIEDDMTQIDLDDPYLQLDFPTGPPLPPPCISVLDASFGYEPGKLLYQTLNFGVDMDSRVAIVGPNGAGKSTFLKLLDGTLETTDGAVRRHPKLSIARFTQHHIEMMELDKDAVTHMRNLGKDDEVSEQEARKYLGRFGLQGDLALMPVRLLSGGQKSRLAFAELAWRQPHLLLLDEPTNHLDLETIEALAFALNKFEGGVVLVSHDERLVQLVSDELWVVMPGTKGRPGTVTVFEGTFDEYKEMLKADMLEKKLLGAGRVKGQSK